MQLFLVEGSEFLLATRMFAFVQLVLPFGIGRAVVHLGGLGLRHLTGWWSYVVRLLVAFVDDVDFFRACHVLGLLGHLWLVDLISLVFLVLSYSIYGYYAIVYSLHFVSDGAICYVLARFQISLTGRKN